MTVRKEGCPSSALHEHPARLLLWAAWFGLLTGLAEVLLLAIKKYVLHGYVHEGLHVVWTAPIAGIFLFSVAGFIFFLIMWRWPRLIVLRFVAFVFAFLGCLSSLLLIKQLSVYAVLLLACGLAVQMTRLITRHLQAFNLIVRCTTGGLVVLLGALAAGVYAWPGTFNERPISVTLPPSSTEAPNVLLIVLDTARARNFSVHGYDRPTTPQLERWLAKTGVRFERAIATASWTLPSHASMFTGRFPHELFADWTKPLDTTYSTLAEVLSANGYLTGGFVANTVFCSRESGLSRGFAHYEDYVISPGQIVLSSSIGRAITENISIRRFVGYYEDFNRKTAAQVNQAFLDWLSRNDRRPFFVFLNYFDAHSPYLPPGPFDVIFGSNKPRGNPRHEPGWQWSPLEIQAELDAYDSAIAYLDHQLGLLFEQLQKRNVLANTLVIVTSDHGEEFGEHGVMDHSYSLYLPVLHVPLLISFPSHVPAAKSVRAPVTLRDLPATVIDLLDINQKSDLPGLSLARYWESTREPDSTALSPILSEVNAVSASDLPDWYPVTRGDIKSLIANRYHYIKNGDGQEELYDFEHDPWEKQDLAASEEGQRLLAPLRTTLHTILARNQRSER